jgi:2-phospho-L-lactate guanylyltransferase
VLRGLGCRELVVLPADLPTLSGRDIDTLVRAGRSGGFALAPDADGVGTNALCLASAQPFRFQFGVNSRQLHFKEALRMGFRAEVVRLPGLEFDVDSPADLARLERQPWRACR